MEHTVTHPTGAVAAAFADRIAAQEAAGLSPLATPSYPARRDSPEPDCGLRTPFQRDRDRIVHSKSFRRLTHKTQVFVAPEGDHYRTRLTHTLEVTGISRTVARALDLNEDLTEAIGLGHDLGHPPFGHIGEAVLDDRLRERFGTGFRHYEHSLRIVERLERDGRGLNLTEPVRDGILCHSGRAPEPATLEGRIVRLVDRIAYINHDIDDAVRAELITPADLPQEPLSLLGGTGGDRIDVLVHDLVDTSYETGTIVQSPEVAKAMDEMRDFLFQTVYPQSLQRAGEQRVRHVITNLMQYFLGHPEEMGQELAASCGRDRAAGGEAGTADPKAAWLELVQAVTDYISGMTDRYAITRYRELFEPRSWAAT